MPIKCGDASWEGDLDLTWTEHTAFDNSDARGLELPPLPEMKYSRAAVFKVDEKKGTVEQI